MASRSYKAWALSTVLGAMLFVAPLGDASAAEPTAAEKETARALMDQGDDRFEKKDYAGALTAFQGAHAIMRVPTTAIEVAKAHEALGHLVEARDAYLEAIRYPKTPNEPAAFTTARQESEAHASELGTKIPSILLNVHNAPPKTELHVTIDNVALPPAAALLPIKVNPGAHTVLITSDATYDVTKTANVTIGQTLTVPVDLVVRPESERPDPGKTGRRLRLIGLISAGVGVTGLAVGTVFGLRASSQQSDANCPSNVCKDEESASTLRSANTSATISNIAFVAGGVLTAGGIALYLFSPKDPEADAAKKGAAPSGPSRISTLRVESRGSGIALTGTF